MDRLESSQLAYAWHRLLRVIGHASSITDPDVHLAAIVRMLVDLWLQPGPVTLGSLPLALCLSCLLQKGISRLADELTRIEQLPRVKWEQVLGALNSAPTRDNSIFAAVTNGGSADNDAIVKEVTGGSAQPRSPPDVNTILRLLGPWLFDACLTRKARFDAGRSEALRCLGKLLCQVSGGRSKRVNWAYGIRSLMALQTALLDDDERISASAVFNWSKVFGLYGNHTLRGAGVITGSFHKAVERIFRYDPSHHLCRWHSSSGCCTASDYRTDASHASYLVLQSGRAPRSDDVAESKGDRQRAPRRRPVLLARRALDRWDPSRAAPSRCDRSVQLAAHAPRPPSCTSIASKRIEWTCLRSR